MNKLDTFLKECGYSDQWGAPDVEALFDQESDFPCYLKRVTVSEKVDTAERISACIEYSAQYCKQYGYDETTLMFSVTERDGCWKAWKDYALTNPKKLSVVESRSKMGPYKVRMYFYVIPKKRARK